MLTLLGHCRQVVSSDSSTCHKLVSKKSFGVTTGGTQLILSTTGYYLSFWFVWYDDSSEQSGGGQASISQRYQGSDVLTSTCFEKKTGFHLSRQRETIIDTADTG